MLERYRSSYRQRTSQSHVILLPHGKNTLVLWGEDGNLACTLFCANRTEKDARNEGVHFRIYGIPKDVER